ncbi:MAG: SUMF1/EgtB/PvdO family nonheme iron enzyme [Lentisphaeria bacterium]
MSKFILSTRKKYILLGCTFFLSYCATLTTIYFLATSYRNAHLPIKTIQKTPAPAPQKNTSSLHSRMQTTQLKHQKLINHKNSFLQNFAKIETEKFQYYYPIPFSQFQSLASKLQKSNLATISDFESSLPAADTKLSFYLRLLDKKPPVPKIQEPKIQEPKIQEPKIQEPKIQEPIIQEPKIQEPKIQEPKIQEPKIQEPKIQEPKIAYNLPLIQEIAEKLDQSSPLINKQFHNDINSLAKALLFTKISPILPQHNEIIANAKNSLNNARYELDYFHNTMQGLTIVEDSLDTTNWPEIDLANLKLQRDAAAKAKLPLLVKNSRNMLFRFIPAGSFIMGSPLDHNDRKNDELPHRVTISSPFYMQISEVTNHENLPLRDISFQQAIKFIEQLNSDEKLPSPLYFLPTEAQWEYAARANNPLSKPNHQISTYANYNNYMLGLPKTPRSLAPNPWGLYDLFGNIKEFCRDRVDSSFFGNPIASTYKDDIVDPIANDGSYVVLRGGSWRSGANSIRYAAREIVKPNAKDWDYGFRLIRIIPPKIK